MHKISSVTSSDPFVVHITYSDGVEVHLDLEPWLVDHTVFARLRDRDLFAQVEVGARGRCIQWPAEREIDVIDLNAAAIRLSDADPRAPGGWRVLYTTATDELNPVSLEVAAAIARSGLTQSQVAEAMGTTQSAVARLCNPDYWVIALRVCASWRWLWMPRLRLNSVSRVLERPEVLSGCWNQTSGFADVVR